MPYFFATDEDRQAMLKAIGVSSVEELFDVIPPDLRLGRPLDIPPSLTELELTQHMTELAQRNQGAGSLACFLGGGSYDHFIPAAVDALASRGEFYTSYTPYQPEVSQGNLQVIFEYQTLICQLTGMDVSNASLYDGGSATAEAAVLCVASTGRTAKVVVPSTLHPEYRQILGAYFANTETRLELIDAPDGGINPEQLAEAVDDQTACVLIQHPNFFGCLEDVEKITDITHQAGAMVIAVVDPLSLGLLKRPGDWGADVVVAEGQSLGNPMNYGGPYLGIMACRQSLMRKMPGRIAGETTAFRGRRCFVLTLQTREQHIRREKATSNICTNQGLFALRASIYLALMGPHGMREAAQLCVQKAHYAARRIFEAPRFSPRFLKPVYKEFVVRDESGQVEQLLSDARAGGFLAGIPLGQWYPDFSDCFLVTVTEKRTRQEIDALANRLHG